MTVSFNEAAGRTCPHGNASSEVGSCYTTPVTATSSAAKALYLGTATSFYCTFISTVDAHVRFGYSTVAAATQDDYLLRANVPEEWHCEKANETHFTVIRDAAATADGKLYYYRSSR